MRLRSSALLALALALAGTSLAPAAHAQPAPTPAQEQPGAKPPDAKIDNSTSQDATKALTAAGYRDLKMLQKGYDSVWHFTATRDGKPVFVSWSRSGGARLEEQ